MQLRSSFAVKSVFACALLVGFRSSANADDQDPSAKFVAATDVGHIELQVVDPDGKPIPRAQIEVRSHPKPEWEILTGTFIRKARYGTFIRTDQQGRLRVKLPDEKLTSLNFSIRGRGYGPFWAGWSMGDKTEVLPASYTAHLDAGQSVGGIIIDNDGNPVVGASIHPSIEYKKRETDESQLGSGWRTKSDENGRWRADCVPAAFDKLRLHIVHPAFVPTYESIVTKDFRLKLDETPHQNITIDRGITLTGKVTNEEGQPIKSAKVRARFLNETREAITNDDGVYQMPGCPEKTTVVTVTAKTFAPGQVEANLQTDMEPVDFQLNPGNTIRVRVVDKDGKPEKKARIFFRRWRKDEYGKGLDAILEYTDQNGVWEWNEAPEDEILVDVCPSGKLQISDQTLVARDEEYVFTSSRQLTIEGMVVDAETRQPVELFRVIPGLRWANSERPHWSRRESFDGRKGKFHYKVDRTDADHLIRIEASGYSPLISRDVSVTEGKVKFEWQLKKAKDIHIKVINADGSVAAGAEAVIGIPGSQISLSNGAFRNTFAKVSKVDQTGALKFSPEAERFLLLILSDTGYAQLACDPKKLPQQIALTPWATVKGKCKIDTKNDADLTLVYLPNHAQPDGLPYVSWRYRTQVDGEGNFQFKRVLPGSGRVAREVRTHVTDTSSRTQYSHSKSLHVESGETTELQFGGDGRTVMGRAIASDKLKDPVDWAYGVVTAEPPRRDPPSIPFPPDLEEDRKAEWAKVWFQTELGKQWQEVLRQFNEENNNRSRYVAAIGKDGSFRMDDLPPGEYEFEITVENRPAVQFGRTRVIAAWKNTVKIPVQEGLPEPYDLGEVIVAPR